MDKIEKCHEGGEGVVVNVATPSIIIPNDYCRCANDTCIIKKECKRWLQKELDKNSTEVGYFVYADFHQLNSDLEDFNYKKDGCCKFIQN